MKSVPDYILALREALDDLWGCIDKPEMDYLQPETVEMAKANHEIVCHGTEPTEFEHGGES